MNEHTLRYSMLIEWSDEDQAFLVTLPEWVDPIALDTLRQRAPKDKASNLSNAISVVYRERWGMMPLMYYFSQ